MKEKQFTEKAPASAERDAATPQTEAETLKEEVRALVKLIRRSPHWLTPEEELPQPQETVLVAVEDDVFLARYTGAGMFMTRTLWRLTEVEFWMRIPELPSAAGYPVPVQEDRQRGLTPCSSASADRGNQVPV